MEEQVSGPRLHLRHTESHWLQQNLDVENHLDHPHAANPSKKKKKKKDPVSPPPPSLASPKNPLDTPSFILSDLVPRHPRSPFVVLTVVVVAGAARVQRPLRSANYHYFSPSSSSFSAVRYPSDVAPDLQEKKKPPKGSSDQAALRSATPPSRRLRKRALALWRVFLRV